MQEICIRLSRMKDERAVIFHTWVHTPKRDNAKPISVRFSVDIALDSECWASTTYGLIEGEARTVKFSKTFRF